MNRTLVQSDVSYLAERLNSYGGSCRGQYSVKMRNPKGSDLAGHTLPRLEGIYTDPALHSRDALHGKQFSVRLNCSGLTLSDS